MPWMVYNIGDMGIVYKKTAWLMLLCMTLCGCRTIVDLFFSKEEPVDVTAAPTWVPEGKPRIRPGILLQVVVGAPGVQPASMEAQVDQNGALPLPYLLTEPVQCDGLTLEDFQQKLTKIYQEYIKRPQISVKFAPFDLKQGVSPYGTVTVMGEVANPGPVNMPPTMDLTVTKALQIAGGTKPFADKRRVRVTRCAEDGSKTTTIVDLIEIGEKGRIDKDMLLRPGDVVNVHEAIW